MRKINNAKKSVAATGVVAALLMIGFSGCKGRTMENMEPTGDTVEVSILDTPSPQSDSV